MALALTEKLRLELERYRNKDFLKAVAATKDFTPDVARRLEAELLARYAPVVARTPAADQALRR